MSGFPESGRSVSLKLVKSNVRLRPEAACNESNSQTAAFGQKESIE